MKRGAALALLALTACVSPESLGLPEDADPERGLFVLVDDRSGEFRAARAFSEALLIDGEDKQRIYWVGLPYGLESLPPDQTTVNVEGTKWGLPSDSTVHRWVDGAFEAGVPEDLKRLRLPLPTAEACLQQDRCIIEEPCDTPDCVPAKVCNPDCETPVPEPPELVSLRCPIGWVEEAGDYPFAEFPRACEPPNVAEIAEDCVEGSILTDASEGCRPVAPDLAAGVWPSLPPEVDVSFRVRPGADDPGCQPNAGECSFRQALMLAETTVGRVGFALAPGEYTRPLTVEVPEGGSMYFVGSGRATQFDGVHIIAGDQSFASVSQLSMATVASRPLVRSVESSTLAFDNVVLTSTNAPCVLSSGNATVQDSLLIGQPESVYGCRDDGAGDKPCSPTLRGGEDGFVQVFDTQIEGALGVLARGRLRVEGSRFFFRNSATPSLAIRSIHAPQLELRDTSFVGLRRAVVHKNGPDTVSVSGRNLIVRPLTGPAPRTGAREPEPEELWIAFSLRGDPSFVGAFDFSQVYVLDMNEGFGGIGNLALNLDQVHLINVGAGVVLNPAGASIVGQVDNSYLRPDRGHGFVMYETAILNLDQIVVASINTQRNAFGYAPIGATGWVGESLFLGSSVLAERTKVPRLTLNTVQIYSNDEDVFRGYLSLTGDDLKVRFDSGGSLRRWLIDTSNPAFSEFEEPLAHIVLSRVDIESQAASILVSAGDVAINDLNLSLGLQRTAMFCVGSEASLRITSFRLNLIPADEPSLNSSGFVAQIAPLSGARSGEVSLRQGELRTVASLLEEPFQQHPDCDQEVVGERLASIELEDVRGVTTLE